MFTHYALIALVLPDAFYVVLSVSEKNQIEQVVKHLPIAQVLDSVRRALHKGNVLLQAEPGAGKSTGLPLALLAQATPQSRIIMLEPRRLAAIGVAERLASQLGEPLGQQIGLRMRGKTSVSASTCIEVVTEGVLTRMLQTDPSLDGVGVVIFDEFHERSLHADLGLALCLEVQQSLREDIRLLLMSATLDAERLVQHLFASASSAVSTSSTALEQISCAGRQFPVVIRWLGQHNDSLTQRVCNAVVDAIEKEEGDLLVFLPGIAEIEKTARILEPRLPANTTLFRLHGGASKATQRAATAKATQSRRRVILSTSIAETSITIDGVRVVIDAGLERRGVLDNSTGATRLETVTASQASAAQRAGRAGRTSNGVCYRLWSETDHARREANWQAEILRADLTSVVVEVAQWGASDINDLPWLESPPAANLARAQNLLASMGAWSDNRLTEHGNRIAGLPVHPRLAHMMLWAAKHGAAQLACQLVALLEDANKRTGRTDVESLLARGLNTSQTARAAQLLKLLNNRAIDSATPSLSVLIAVAYPDWIGRQRTRADGRFALSCGAGALLHTDDSLAHTPWIAIAGLGGSAKEARVFLASALSIEELENWTPELFNLKRHLGWDDNAGRVIAEQQKRIGALVIESSVLTDISDQDKALALLDGVRQRGIECLPWTDECRTWQARVQLTASLPQSLTQTQMPWPVVDDATLLLELENWLLVWLSGKHNLKALSQLNLMACFNGMLDYAQSQLLDTLLPTHFKVPSGSRIRLRYTNEAEPVLAVKLQEMFGCVENPSIAKGQLPLKVELLSPARRAVQVTTDLANFWTNSYPAVKKDMAGRYPKHDWPDDPLSANPTAYAKPRKKR